MIDTRDLKPGVYRMTAMIVLHEDGSVLIQHQTIEPMPEPDTTSTTTVWIGGDVATNWDPPEETDR